MNILKSTSPGRAYGRSRAVVLVTLLVGTIATPPALADHGGPHVNPLGQGTFVDDVSAAFKLKGIGEGTTVLKLKDASDMVVLHITIESGGIGGWHTHGGTGTLINLGPGVLTNAVGDDCEPHYYMANEAFVDPGDGELHAVRNDSEDPVELIAVFYGVDGPPVSPAEAPHDCEFVP
jgi:quercetin dioxygenase-like cupin family protein